MKKIVMFSIFVALLTTIFIGCSSKEKEIPNLTGE